MSNTLDILFITLHSHSFDCYYFCSALQWDRALINWVTFCILVLKFSTLAIVLNNSNWLHSSFPYYTAPEYSANSLTSLQQTHCANVWIRMLHPNFHNPEARRWQLKFHIRIQYTHRNVPSILDANTEKWWRVKSQLRLWE